MALHIPPCLPPLLQMAYSDRLCELTSWKWSHETILGRHRSWSQCGAATLWTRWKHYVAPVTTDSTPSSWGTGHLILWRDCWEIHITAHWVHTWIMWESKSSYCTNITHLITISELPVKKFLFLGWCASSFNYLWCHWIVSLSGDVLVCCTVDVALLFNFYKNRNYNIYKNKDNLQCKIYSGINMLFYYYYCL